MTDVLFFSYHNTSSWWQYLADNLKCAQSVSLVSDIRGEPGICIVDDFYNHLNTRNCKDIALDYFTEATCDEIIRRCRVLRNLDKNKALSMIGSMYLIFEALIQNEKPKLVISFIIDRYPTDVFERILKAHKIPFLGITASIVPDYVMFMDRGKLIKVRTPEQSEVEQSRKLLIDESYTPSYVNKSKKFSALNYWKTFLYFKLRGLAFQYIRFLKRDRLNLHYLDALNYLDHKPRVLDYKVLGLFHKDWRDRLDNSIVNNRIFFPLQLLPEASLDYWLDDLALLHNEELIWKIVQVFGEAGYTVFIKDHPLQFGFRKREIMERLAKLPYVVLVPYEVPATFLLKECPITVTCTGTVGFQSVLAGSCSIVSGAYYSDEEHFVHFHNEEDIKKLPEKIRAFQKNKPQKMSVQAIDALINKVLSASLPGDLFSFRRFDKKKPEHTQKVQSLVDSLNEYLPQYLTD